MANNLYKAYGQNQNSGADMMSNFQQFMNAMQGKNPRELINQMLSSGQLSQNQLNMVQQKAQQMSGMFNGIKSKFGF